MITINSSPLGEPLRRPWKNGIAIGRANDLVRADHIDHLRWLQREIGFRSCRFHGLFHDDMAVVRRRRDGSLVYQWHHVDKAYDSLLSLGLKPFVELNPMPAALASGSQTMFHYKMNVTPPRLWTEWGDLVAAFARHCVERYGLAEVATWNFEVWNEPNLPGFWSGSKEDYFLLYSHAAHAVKSVDPSLRVGGPATSKAYWIADLISHCKTHNVPLDFISTHLYPQDEFVEFEDRDASPHDPGNFFGDIVRRAKETACETGGPDLPVHWSEWNTQLATSSADVTWGENRYVDAIQGGSFVARNMIELDDAAETFTYWVASDIFEESPIPNAPFSHTYGLLTIHGIPKAACNAFRFLNRMRGRRLTFQPDSAPPQFCGGVATLEGEGVQMLLWNDVPPGIVGTTWADSLSVSAPGDGPWIAVISKIREMAGSPFESWEAMGRPLNLSLAQEALLRTHSEPECHSLLLQTQNERVTLPFSLAKNEVLQVELRPRGHTSAPKSEDLSPEECTLLEAQLGEKSRS